MVRSSMLFLMTLEETASRSVSHTSDTVVEQAAPIDGKDVDRLGGAADAGDGFLRNGEQQTDDVRGATRVLGAADVKDVERMDPTAARRSMQQVQCDETQLAISPRVLQETKECDLKAMTGECPPISQTELPASVERFKNACLLCEDRTFVRKTCECIEWVVCNDVRCPTGTKCRYRVTEQVRTKAEKLKAKDDEAENARGEKMLRELVCSKKKCEATTISENCEDIGGCSKAKSPGAGPACEYDESPCWCGAGLMKPSLVLAVGALLGGHHFWESQFNLSGSVRHGLQGGHHNGCSCSTFRGMSDGGPQGSHQYGRCSFLGLGLVSRAWTRKRKDMEHSIPCLPVSPTLEACLHMKPSSDRERNGDEPQLNLR